LRKKSVYHLEDEDDEEEDVITKSSTKNSKVDLTDPINLLDPEKDRFSFYLYYLKYTD